MIQRYHPWVNYNTHDYEIEMLEDGDGAWVKWEDVLDLLAPGQSIISLRWDSDDLTPDKLALPRINRHRI